MRKQLAGVLALGVVLLLAVALNARDKGEGKADGPMLVHNVYFTLKDNSPEAKKKLVAACKKHLSGHAGEVYFAAGPRAAELNGRFNDQDFDVALNIVFKNKAAHDEYLESQYHKQFVAAIEDNMKKVRVFDAMAEK